MSPAACAHCGVADCHALYDELSIYTLSLGDTAFLHQLIVDAYAAQHADEQTKPIGMVFSVIGLFLVNEHGYTGREVQRAHMLLAQRSKTWPRFHLPAHKAALTVRDVLAAAPEQQPAAIHAWSRAVWEVWCDQREAVSALVIGHLGWV